MERKEKTEFLLEQMRLLVLVAKGKDAEDQSEGKDDLRKGEADWIKVRVGGRKVNEKFLKESGNEVLQPYYTMCYVGLTHGYFRSSSLNSTIL